MEIAWLPQERLELRRRVRKLSHEVHSRPKVCDFRALCLEGATRARRVGRGRELP